MLFMERILYNLMWNEFGIFPLIFICNHDRHGWWMVNFKIKEQEIPIIDLHFTIRFTLYLFTPQITMKMIIFFNP